jgi:hypothetical protein
MASTLKPSPNGRNADFGDNASLNNLCGDLTGAESREWVTIQQILEFYKQHREAWLVDIPTVFSAPPVGMKSTGTPGFPVRGALQTHVR